MPCARHKSATFRPASPSLTIARICSSVNLLRFIGPPQQRRTLILRVANYRGQVMATPGALSALNPDDLLTIVERHASGDWGERCQEDVAANEAALHDGSRLLSA